MSPIWFSSARQDRRRCQPYRSAAGTFLTIVLTGTLVIGCGRGQREGSAAGQTGDETAAASAAIEPLDLAVMSFNIRYGTANDGENSWPQRRGIVFSLLRGQAPDLIGVQEALRFQLDEITEAVAGYTEIGVGREDGVEAGEYAAILYRTERFQVLDSGTFWLSDTPEVPGSTSWGNSITRICTWARFEEIGSGRTFYLFNLHLDHRSQPSRERSAGLLAERIVTRAHPDPVIATGDFNAGEENPAILSLTTSAPQLRDTFRVLYPDADEAGTFNGFQGDRSGEKIDFIFVDDAWEVFTAAILHTAVEGRYPSDHFPVTARLRLP